jgi:hypothetical protein
MLLLLSLLFGCAHLSESVGLSPPSEALQSATLGWRLVPGQSLSYAHRVRLLRGQEEVGREEHWTYLVKEVSPQGVALLEGRLTGFGALYASEDGRLSSELLDPIVAIERKKMEDARVWIRLSRSGQIQSIEGLPWQQTLCHGLLGLVFPLNPIEPGDGWSDPAMLAPFLNLVSPRVAVIPVGKQVLMDLGTRTREETRVLSEGSLILGGEDVPSLALSGEALWDLQQGALNSRRLNLSLRQYDADFGSRLFLEIERQH